MTTTLEELAELRACNYCGQPKRIYEFRWRNKAAGLRHYQCRSCVAKEARLRRAAKREGHLFEGIRVVDRLKSPESVLLAANRMVAAMGGPEAAAKAWYTVFEEAGRQGKLHIRLRCYRLAFQLMKATEKLSPSEDNSDDLSDEEIEHVTVGTTLRLMAKDPEFAVHVVTAALEDHPRLRPVIYKALVESENGSHPVV